MTKRIRLRVHLANSDQIEWIFYCRLNEWAWHQLTSEHYKVRWLFCSHLLSISDSLVDSVLLRAALLYSSILYIYSIRHAMPWCCSIYFTPFTWLNNKRIMPTSTLFTLYYVYAYTRKWTHPLIVTDAWLTIIAIAVLPNTLYATPTSMHTDICHFLMPYN